MGEPLRSEPRTMAKVQKTLMVPQDLFKLIEAHEQKTGASFAKIMTAATLQFFFTKPAEPDSTWMELAVLIEKGDLAVGDVVRLLIDRRLKKAEAFKQLGLNKGSRAYSIAHAEHRKATDLKDIWDNRLAAADTPLDAILYHLHPFYKQALDTPKDAEGETPK